MKKILIILLMVSSVAYGQTSETEVRGNINSKLPTRVLGNRPLKAVDVRAALNDVVSYAAQRTPFLTMAQLRAGKADTAKVVQVLNNNRVWAFRYDPTSLANDDSASVVNAAGRRYIIEADVYTPEMFGATGNGIADDTQAFRRMARILTDGQTILFTRWYKITGTVTFAGNRITLKGGSGYSLPIVQGFTPGMQLFTFTGYGVLLENLSLKGDGGSNGIGATMLGARFVRANGTKDIDSKIRNCLFDGFSQAIYGKGTNLEVSGNLISSSLGGVLFERNSTDESRGLRVINNRFHSMGSIGLAAKCVVLNTDAFACEVNNNYADNLYTFYEGPINGITVNGNTIYRVAADAINVLTATYTTQQRTGSVSNNIIFQNAPSYIGNGMVLRMQNAQAQNNVIIGPRGHGISLIGTTGSIISGNTIVSPNYNLATDGAIYDGIYVDASSQSNMVSNNHIRSGGIIGRSALNVIPANNTVLNNWIDPLYTTPYQTQKPLLIPVQNSKLGIKKVPTADLDVSGNTFRMQKMDVIAGVPIELQGSFTKVSGTEFLTTSIKSALQSSADGAEKANIVFSVVSNGTMSDRAEIPWNGGLKINNADWANNPLQIGNSTLWINGAGQLKIHSTTPGSDAAGQTISYLTGAKTYDPPSIAAAAEVSTTVTVTGAALGQFARASFSQSLAGLKVTSYVSAANTVTVVFKNDTEATVDLASGTLSAKVD